MPTAAPSTRTTTSPPPPSTSRGWLRRCAVTGAWRACTGCWTWRSGMTCRATAAGTGPKTWHRAPLCARAGAGQSGQGQREDAAQDGQLEPGVPPPGPSAPSPHLIAVHPDSAPWPSPKNLHDFYVHMWPRLLGAQAVNAAVERLASRPAITRIKNVIVDPKDDYRSTLVDEMPCRSTDR